jgi:hypothetical protein
LFAVCATAFGGFDGVEELAAFAAAIFDEGLDVLLEAFYSLFHLGVELACSLKASIEIDVCLVDFAVSAQDCVSLSGERFIFVLFWANAFVLKEVAVCPGQFFHDRRLLVHGLQDAVLVRAEFLQFRFEELVFLTGGGFLVQDEDIADVVRVDLCMVSKIQ